MVQKKEKSVKDRIRREKLKKGLFTGIKLCVSVLLLAYLTKKIDLNNVAAGLHAIPAITLILLIFSAIIKQGIEIFNWSRYLRLNPDYRFSARELIVSHFIGHSLRFVVPGGYGTLGKIYFVEGSKKNSLFAVGIEKFFIIWLALAFAAFSSMFYFSWPRWMGGAALAVVLASPLLIYLVHHVVRHDNWREMLRNYRSIIPGTMALQVLYMLITAGQYFIILHNVSNITYFHTLIAVSLILCANIIPIAYAGLGLRESFAMEILPAYGVLAEEAVLASLLVFFFNTALPAIAGVVVYWGKKRM
ncbi:MAG: flippase-like domain-containing protein [Candidatus Cloacimonetes bacterium]|nr:flippase-like domain-containing protein [Candidatus Cloacimonadota bacterium]